MPAACYSTRSWDWCLPGDEEIKQFLLIKVSMKLVNNKIL